MEEILEFVNDIGIFLTYAALIPFYGLFILILVIKKNKHKKTVNSKNTAKLKI